MTTFTELGVVEPITSALAKAGITDAFPIQELSSRWPSTATT